MRDHADSMHCLVPRSAIILELACWQSPTPLRTHPLWPLCAPHSSRGFLIEQILTKVVTQRLKFGTGGGGGGGSGDGGGGGGRGGGSGSPSGWRQTGPQIVCMSATLGNPEMLEQWLGAALYVSD